MKIAEVFILPNGMIAVYDEKSKQVPELQGCIFYVMDKIKERADEETKFTVIPSEYPKNTLDLSWYFKERKEMTAK